jgi:uncharacterized protein (DUF58 family)
VNLVQSAFGARREPHRPGPGAVPDQLLRALELNIARRVEALLAGDHRSAHAGQGSELMQIRLYEPGDDPRLIDWNVTARTGQPHVRVHLAERVLVTWLALDVSPSMTFGTADRRKADVAEGVALAVGHVASRRGNRLGLMTFGGSISRTLPPRAGRVGLLGVLEELRRQPDTEGGGSTPLGEALHQLGAVARQRSLVVVVSDFRGPLDWREALLAVAGAHEVLAVEIRDPREQELPDVGPIWLVDPETGRHLRIDTRSERLRRRFALAAGEERLELARLLASAGVPHVVLSTAGDWLRPLAAFLRRREERT